MLPRINNEKVNKIIRKAIGIAWGIEEMDAGLKENISEAKREWEQSH